MIFGPNDFRNSMMFWASMTPAYQISGFLNAITPSVGPAYPAQHIAKTTPIVVDIDASDPGIKVAQAGTNKVRLSGTANGDRPMKDIMGYTVGSYAQGVHLKLDIDRAPTETVSGKTDYTEKNSRLISVMTDAGQSPLSIATGLADKINKHPQFHADVVKLTGTTVELVLSRR